MPLDFSTLRAENQIAVAIFSKLYSNVVADIGYTGKSLTGVDLLLDLYEVRDKLFVLDLISLLDNHHLEEAGKARAKAQKDLKKK